MDKRAPKLIENPKQALFIRASTASQQTQSILQDLFLLKKPDATNFSKKNVIHPFEDSSSLEFFSEKQDASLFVVASHSKKRPNNLTFIRTFDFKVLDMLEIGVTNYVGCKEFKVCLSARRIIVESRWDGRIETIDGILWRVI